MHVLNDSIVLNEVFFQKRLKVCIIKHRCKRVEHGLKTNPTGRKPRCAEVLV